MDPHEFQYINSTEETLLEKLPAVMDATTISSMVHSSLGFRVNMTCRSVNSVEKSALLNRKTEFN